MEGEEGGSDDVCIMGSTSTRPSLPFSRRTEILCRPHGQDFFLPTIGVTPKKTSGTSRLKSLCNEVSIHLSLKGSPILARLNK